MTAVTCDRDAAAAVWQCMKHYTMLFAYVLMGALAGCSDGLAPRHGTAADLNGFWNQDVGSTVVAGNSFSIALSLSGDVVSGAGSYAGEAGPFGNLDISGTAQADQVHLLIAYRPNATVFPQLKPDTAQFDGVLTTRDRIDGTIIRGGAAPQPFSLVRFRQDPLHTSTPIATRLAQR